MKHLIGGAVCIFLLAITGTAAFAAGETNNPGSLSKKDYEFIKAATSGGLAEIKMGQLAKKKGINIAVKQFGQQMIDDHGQANTELRVLAARKGITLPIVPAAKEQEAIDKLSGLYGDDFDRAYAQDMVEDHQADVKEFQKAAEKSDDADLRAWAAKVAPRIDMHFQMATNMLATVTPKK